MPTPATVTVYHGSPTWFERPDPDYARIGNGNSVHGFGFNMTDSLSYVGDHMMRRETEHGVIFALELDRDRILASADPLCGKWLDRAVERADILGLRTLSSSLRRLRAAGEAGEAFMWPGYRADGAARTVRPVEMTAGLLRDMIRQTFPDQRLENEFLRGMGVQAVWTHDVLAAIDYTSLPPMRVHRVIGRGPEGMPSGVRAGEPALRQHRIEPDRQLESGDLLSGELSTAWLEVRRAGDERLAAAFRRLARLVVSDSFAVPADPYAQRTARQNFGFDVRNAIGLAVQRGLDGGDMRGTIDRARKSLEGYIDDPRMFLMIGELAGAVDAHNSRKAAAARAAEAVITGAGQQPCACHPAEAATLARLAAIGDPDAFGHARAAFRAVRQMEDADRLPKAGADAMMTQVAETLRAVSGPAAAPERADRLALQLAAAAAPAARGERWLPELTYRMAEAVRGFARAAARGGINLDPARPLPPGEVRASVPATVLLDATRGRLAMAQGIEFPVAGHPGWTVVQKAGSQMLKLGGKLASFADHATGIRVPAVVQQDGQAVDVAYEDGRQVSTRTTLAAFAARAGAAPAHLAI